jgi:hypothetical protein
MSPAGASATTPGPYFSGLPASGDTELQTVRFAPLSAPLPTGQILIAGGFGTTDYLQSAELLNPANDTFIALPASGSTELQTARAGAVAATLPDGQVRIAGGEDDSDFLRSAEPFNPVNETFTGLPASGSTELQMPRGVGVAALLLDGRVLIAAGGNGSGLLQSAELFNSAPQAETAGIDVGAQTVGEPSAVQAVVVTNVGAQALRMSGAALDTGGNRGDFAITADACAGRTLALGQGCTVSGRFTPTATETRTATIDLIDNETAAATIEHSGIGVAPNTGPVGATGPQGSHGPQGNPGQIELITCRTVTKTVKRHIAKRKVTLRRCTTRLISGTARFTAAAAHATLTRDRITYATGNAEPARLVLYESRPLRPGRYTLTLTRDVGHHRLTSREQVTIGLAAAPATR